MKGKLFSILAVSFLVILVAAAGLGPRHRAVRNLATNVVGSVVLDSSAKLASLRAVEDLRLDGKAEDFISFFGDLGVAPNGNIVVPQDKDFQYRFYSPTGKLLTKLGRRGQGPGEFTSQGGNIGWTADTLWIWDGMANRITYASSEGRYLDQESFHYTLAAPRDWMRFPPMIGLASIEGIRGGEYLLFGYEWRFPITKSWWANKRPLVAAGGTGVMRRLVGDFPRYGDSDVVTMPTSGGRAYSEAASHMMFLPLRALPFYRIAPDASRIAYLSTRVEGEHGGHLRLIVVGTNGDTLVAREYPFVGEAIPKHVSDSIVKRRLSQRGSRRPEVMSQFRALAPRRTQPVYAPVDALVAGRDSTVWIGMRSTTKDRTWIVLDARGEPVGSLTLPANTRVSAADRQHVWTVELDADETPSIVRYRVDGW